MRSAGYTLLVSGSTTFVLLPLMSRKLPYQPGDFAPVSQLTRLAMAAVVNPSVQEGTLPEIADCIRRAPSEFLHAHTGMGSSGHLKGERCSRTMACESPPSPTAASPRRWWT